MTLGEAPVHGAGAPPKSWVPLSSRHVQLTVNLGITRAMDDSGNNDKDPRWVRQSTADIRTPLLTEAVATTRNATVLRRQFRDWLILDLPPDVVDDLVLAVYEAIANAAEHAYANHADGPGPMRLEAHRAADHVLITVSDEGRWRTSTRVGCRGRGIPLMRLLAQNMHTRCDHQGTVVHFRVELPASFSHPA